MDLRRKTEDWTDRIASIKHGKVTFDTPPPAGSNIQLLYQFDTRAVQAWVTSDRWWWALFKKVFRR